MKFDINSNSCREIYIILNKLDLYKRLPEEFKKYIEENQNFTHEFDFNSNAPLYEQIENNDTKILLTYLFVKYINTNPIDAINIKESIIELMKK